jgi:phosphoserine phosphatase
MIEHPDHSLKACVTDWDGTLRPGFMIADWLGYLAAELQISACYYKTMLSLIQRYKDDELEYRNFASEAVATYGEALEGLKCKDVDEVSSSFAKKDVKNLFPFTINLLNAINKAGMSIHVLSGSPLRPILSYARHLPISSVFAVDAVCTSKGVFEGKIAKNYALRRYKREAIQSLKSKGFRIHIALGDSSADVPLLNAAEHSFLIKDGDRGLGGTEYIEVTKETVLPAVAEALK